MRKSLLLVLLALLLSFSSKSAIAEDLYPEYIRPLPAEAGDEIISALKKNGQSNFLLDLNVKIHVPLSSNPYITEEELNTNLWATIIKPTFSSTKLPTIVIPSGYTRMVAALGALIVPYGYNVVALDLRGSGSSGGQWTALNLVEQYDLKYVIDEWIPAQEWSDGKIGAIGMSYLAIITMLAAGLVDRDENGEPAHLKAIYPLSFFSDAFHGIGRQGGTFNASLLSTWIMATGLLACMPPLLFLGDEGIIATGGEFKEAVEIWISHIMNMPKLLNLFADPSIEPDGLFWQQKSSKIYWPVKPEGGWGFYEGDNCVWPSKLPVFTATGWFDMFTRGTLQAYQYGLSRHSVADKAMIVGEWAHAGACLGAGLPAMETMRVAMRWFNWKIKGKNDPFMVEFPVVLRVMGEKRWRAEKSWPLPDSRVEDKTLYLSKSNASPIMDDWFTNNEDNFCYSLVDKISSADTAGDNPVLENDLSRAIHGLTSRSAQRWLYGGVMAYTEMMKFGFSNDIDDQFMMEDERYDEKGVLTFTTEPLEEDIEIIGAPLLKFWARTEFNDPATQLVIESVLAMIKNLLGADAHLVLDQMKKEAVDFIAELNDVFPDGRARNITSGWQNTSYRQYDPGEAGGITEHALDPAYTPFDPFYDYSYKNPKPINENDLYEYAVEYYPTCNVFKAGHRIRISLSTTDVPHLLPVLTPSLSTIVIDSNHPASFEFKTTNNDDEGVTWKWLSPSGNNWAQNKPFNDYLLSHNDVSDPNEFNITGEDIEENTDEGIKDDSIDEENTTENDNINEENSVTGCGSAVNAAVISKNSSPELLYIMNDLILMLLPFTMVLLRRLNKKRKFNR